MMFNATFNTISVISWRSVLLVEETGGPGENHRLVASEWQTNKLKNKAKTVETVPKSNREIVEKGTVNTSNTQMYNFPALRQTL